MPLTVRKLGKKGRFANQLFQYAHLRQRARDEGCDYCCPPWVGQKLFGLEDPPPVKGAKDIGHRFPLDSQWYDKALFRSLYRPTADVTNKIEVSIPHDRQMIGIHLRRGDFGTFRRWSARYTFVAPTWWYIDWLHQNIHRLNNPILFIASDDLAGVIDDLSEFDTACQPLGPVVYPDYGDFYALSRCDVLLISNSSFGFAASMLNEKATEFWRPRLGEKRLIAYEPWHSPLVFKDERY